jgi:hypothetical protein
MATARQIAANRRTAKNSTGPRTAAGKAASRFNALKHGIDAQSHCLPSEDPATLEQLVADYYDRFAPAGPEARALIDTLVACEWELRRLRQASTELWQKSEQTCLLHDNKLPMAESFIYEQTLFLRLQRIMDATYRNYRHALKALQELPPAPQPEESKPATPELASFRIHAANGPKHPNTASAVSANSPSLNNPPPDTPDPGPSLGVSPHNLAQ